MVFLECEGILLRWLLLLLLLLLLKPAAHAQVGKTPRAPAPQKTEDNTTQGSNQRLTAPLKPSSVPVSNTV